MQLYDFEEEKHLLWCRSLVATTICIFLYVVLGVECSIHIVIQICSFLTTLLRKKDSDQQSN